MFFFGVRLLIISTYESTQQAAKADLISTFFYEIGKKLY